MAFLHALTLAVAFLQGGPQGDLPAKYQRHAPTGVVARVNGVDITAADVEPLLWDWWGADAIQDLITYQLVKGEADKLRINVSDKDVEAAIDKFLENYGHELKQGISAESVLAKQGLTRSRMFLRFRAQLLARTIVDRNFAPAKMVKVSTLLIKPINEQTSSVSDAIKRADEAYKRLKDGEKWDVIFPMYNADTRANASKGLVGWRDLSIFPATVADELSKLKPGEITSPVQTEYGIQIFRLELAGKDAKGQDLEEMKNIYAQAGESQLMTRLTKEAKIERLFPPASGH
ncbi:MAG TPA: peptidylprolyl isomerase [Fimbriimonadaceae bacterium]|nr:peptidylprolyl isomerase [Fimbriimonadaceae bacterium]